MTAAPASTSSRRDLFTLRSGAIRVVCGGIADGQTIQKADDHLFPPSAWDNLPSQNVCTAIDADAVLDLISEDPRAEPGSLKA